jgi:hypothetical protein
MSERWADQVKPHAERFILGGKLGLDVNLKPDAAQAVGELIDRMAAMLDATEARADAAMLLIAMQRAERESFGSLVKSCCESGAMLACLLLLMWLLP